MAIKDYENILGIGIIGAIGLGAMFMGVQPEIIAVSALSAIAGYIGGKSTNIMGTTNA